MHNSPIHYMNFISQIFETNGSLKCRNALKHKGNLNRHFYFKWLQIITSTPETWSKFLKKTNSNANNFLIHDHNLIRGSHVLVVENLASKEMYQVFIFKVVHYPRPIFVSRSYSKITFLAGNKLTQRYV